MIHARGRRRPALIGVAVALALGVIALGVGTAGAVGPYPDLGSCSVFPQPPASTSPAAPSLATEAAWNQNISKAPRAANSAKVIAYIMNRSFFRYDRIAIIVLELLIMVILLEGVSQLLRKRLQ